MHRFEQKCCPNNEEEGAVQEMAPTVEAVPISISGQGNMFCV